MIALAALMLLQAAAPVTAPDQIVVMAERLRAIEAQVGQDQDGRWRCSLSASSGDERTDSRLCRAATECAREHGNDREAIGSCMDRERSGIVEDFRRELSRNRS